MNHAIFERDEAASTLIYIADHPDCTRSDVMFENENPFGDNGLKINSYARFRRIMDFLHSGLITATTKPSESRLDIRLNVTDLGKRLAECFKEYDRQPFELIEKK